LSFASAKRGGGTTAKDSLKGKAAAVSVNEPTVGPIRVGGKRKYEPEPEPEPEREDAEEVLLERESLDAEDSRWNKAYGQARAKMGNLHPGPSSARPPFAISSVFADGERVLVHAQGQSPVHHILRVFDLYVA
jgi:DNA polymerase delta subunit 4